MGTLERTETLAHRIGTNGRVSVKTISGMLRVRGIDGEEAHLSVTYRIRAADQAAAERALETGRVIVDRGPDSLEVETPERRLSTGLAWLFGGARVGADITVEVPWGTRIRYETMSGSIEAVALVGDQKYRTVSGDIRLWSLGGLVEASSISGSVILDNGGDVRVRASTVSGGIRVRARRFYGMSLSTTSGSIAVVGALDPSGDHRAESISGSVDLTPLNGVTAELRTVSGSIASDVENRVEGGRGFWRSIVGDGQAVFKVNSTSGGLRILAARPGDEVVAPTAPAPLRRLPPAPRLRQPAQLSRRPARRNPRQPSHRRPGRPGTRTSRPSRRKASQRGRAGRPPGPRTGRDRRRRGRRSPRAGEEVGRCRASSKPSSGWSRKASSRPKRRPRSWPRSRRGRGQRPAARTRAVTAPRLPGRVTGSGGARPPRRPWPGGGCGVFVAENGRPVINLQIPLAAAGFAIDQVPGLSPDHRSRIVEAIQTGMTGPILEVSDHGDEVRIVIE